MIIEIQGRQAKRKSARRKFRALHEDAPEIDIDDSEFKSKRTALKKEFNEEVQGCDADIDWIMASLRLAVVDQFSIEGTANPSIKDIDDRIDAYGRMARPHLSAENQQTLDKEADRAAAQEAEAKKVEDEHVREVAEKSQGVFPGMEETVKEAKSKGKKAGKVKTRTDPFFVTEEDQTPREDSYLKPEEDDLSAFKDEPAAIDKVETLPPSEGTAPDKKPAKPKKAATTKKPAAKAKKK